MPLGLAPRATPPPGQLRDLFALVLEAVPAGIALLRGPELAFELVNPAFQALSPDLPMLGRRLADVFPEDLGPHLAAILRAVATGERVRASDVPVRVRRAGTVAAESFYTFEYRRIEVGRGDAAVVLVTALDAAEAVRGRRAAEMASTERAVLHEANRAQVEVAQRARASAELLASLAADLNRNPDLATVLQTALGRAVALLGGDDGSVYLLDRQGTVLRGVAELRPLGRMGRELEVDDLPHARDALLRRAPLFFASAEAKGAEAAWCREHRMRSFFALPMLDGDRRLGLIFVSRRTDGADPSPEELSFGEAIAAHCALALTRAQTYEAERTARARAEGAEAVTRRIAQRLAVSQEITAALSSAHTQLEVADAIFAAGLRAVGAHAGAIFVPAGEEGLRVLRSDGYSHDAVGPWLPAVQLSVTTPATEAFRTRAALFVRDGAELEARWPRAPGAPGGARAALPLVVEGRATGVLDLGFTAPRDFDLEDRAFLASLAHKCAQALERARLYEAERDARAEAERVGKLQEQLLAVVGHDLRTPLSAISMAASVLFRRGGLDERQAQTVTRIATSAERMTGIIRDLLDFSRARHGGGIPLARAPTDLAAIAEKAILELQAAHPGCALELVARGDAALDGDEPRLLQVVSNLVGNAVQHGSPASPIEVRVEGCDAELRLVVHNGGAPIAPELLPVLFEPFRQGEPREAESESVGLGLFIVREIVRAHGGDVKVQSAEGEGTTFTVRLPRR
jgi:signal transduction histidine kinase